MDAHEGGGKKRGLQWKPDVELVEEKDSAKTKKKKKDKADDEKITEAKETSKPKKEKAKEKKTETQDADESGKVGHISVKEGDAVVKKASRKKRRWIPKRMMPWRTRSCR